MKNLKFLTEILLILIFLTSCRTSINKEPTIKDSEGAQSDNVKKEKSKMEIRISCGDGDISEFINEGWIITKEYSEEKICTWASFPASKDCDMEKDKGCKITKPDKIGEEKVYFLERE